MRRVSVIKGKALIGSQQRAQRRPPYRFTFTLQPLRLNMSLLLLHIQCTTHRSAGSLRIVYSPLFVVTVHWGTSYKWTGIWRGSVWCGRRRGRRQPSALGVTYFLGRQGLLVCWSALCVSCPLLCLCLPVFPHRSSPPARLTDRQMLSGVHLQLWASITLHKQPIASTQAANFACLSPFR